MLNCLLNYADATVTDMPNFAILGLASVLTVQRTLMVTIARNVKLGKLIHVIL